MRKNKPGREVFFQTVVLVFLSSEGQNGFIQYILSVSGLSPRYGSLVGGTVLTVTGSGFSDDVSENKVLIGETEIHNITNISYIYIILGLILFLTALICVGVR